uniref:TOG domain-containing protein n=1 Tax=Clastoptera arizonana TaxID=38151 RepID=A0A1B6EFB0_9HEMI
MRKILDSLKPFSEDPLMQSRLPLTEEEKKSALYTLRELVQDASTATLLDHFKSLLRILLGLLSVNSGPIKSLVLVVLSEMLKRRSLTDHFNNYVELLILKMFHIYRDPCKEVQRSAESCIIDMSTLFNPEMVIRVLAPLITTEPIPVNLISIKMLTRLIEARGRHPVQQYLPDLMPGLVQAYDNEDSSVRKSAVFCMVALHIAVGDEALKPYLASLNGSKLKLLNVYIRRAQHSSPPATPRCQGEHSDPSDPS